MRLLARYRLAASLTQTHETRTKQTRTASPKRHSMLIMTAIGRMYVTSPDMPFNTPTDMNHAMDCISTVARDIRSPVFC